MSFQFAAPPAALTAGMPDPSTIQKQKDAYLKMLDEQAKQGTQVLEAQTKQQKDFLKVQAEQQKKQYFFSQNASLFQVVRSPMRSCGWSPHPNYGGRSNDLF